jgi:hypothetical protein
MSEDQGQKLPNSEAPPPTKSLFGQYILLATAACLVAMMLFPPFTDLDRSELSYGFILTPPQYDKIHISLLCTQLFVVLAAGGSALAAQDALRAIGRRIRAAFRSLRKKLNAPFQSIGRIGDLPGSSLRNAIIKAKREEERK